MRRLLSLVLFGLVCANVGAYALPHRAARQMTPPPSRRQVRRSSPHAYRVVAPRPKPMNGLPNSPIGPDIDTYDFSKERRQEVAPFEGM